MNIKTTIKNIIECSLKKANLDNFIKDIVINNDKFFYYSTDIALLISNKINKNPKEIGKYIINNINNNIIEKIEIDNNGIIEIYIKKEYYLNTINTIIEENTNYGTSDIGKGKKVNIELLSNNPLDYVNINDIKCAIFGDNLSRILSYNGYNTTKEYYALDSNEKTYGIAKEIKNIYQEINNQEELTNSYKYDIAKYIYTIYGDKKKDEDLEFFKKNSIEKAVDILKKELDRYRININITTTEESLHDNYIIEDVIDKFRMTNQCYIEEESLLLNTKEFGASTNEYLITNEGLYTKFAQNIAYQIDKINRGYDNIINITNTKNIDDTAAQAALNILDYQQKEIITKIINPIIKENESIIDELDINTIRYYLSLSNSKEETVIDLNTINNDNNKYYYIERTYALLHSITKKYKKITQCDEYTTLNSDIAYTILNKLVDFNDVVIESGIKKEPNIITKYVYELAKLVNIYYNKEDFETENESTIEKINLLCAIQIIIKNALDLIGIIPREEM